MTKITLYNISEIIHDAGVSLETKNNKNKNIKLNNGKRSTI